MEEQNDSKDNIGTVSDEVHLTASVWANRSQLPYRTILNAARSGELIAYRPAGATRGSFYISGKDFRAWMDRVRVVPSMPTNTARRDYSVREKAGRQLDRPLAIDRIKRAQARSRGL